jgi:uncharacterized membrane protein YecN with MAPEG domain
MTAAARALLALALLALATLFAPVAHAQAGDAVTDEVVRDREFGVSARHFGLERRVEMFQWRARGAGYERVWSESAIDSTGFAPGHDNPDFPLRSRRWVAERVTLDDKPVDRSVIEQFGQWTAFRPNFSALPGNLAATFQPEGDGLGSAENPLDPQVGDLRIAWRELTLPQLQGRIVLERGTWFPIAGAPAKDADPPAVAPAGAGGVVMPKITLLFAALHAVILLGLSAQVVRWRWREKIGIGQGESRDLHRWIRVHGNFTEYVPITLLLFALLELSGFARGWLLIGGTALLFGRLLHAWGLGRYAGTSFGRMTGMLLTLSVLATSAIAALFVAMR